MLFLQLLISGVLLGGLYASMAAGFSLVWGVMNIINLAHGSMVVMGAYVAYFANSRLGVDPFMTIPVAAALLFGVGYLLQRFLLNRVVQVSVFLTLILTFGLDMVFTNVHLRLFTADIRSVHPSYAGEGLRFGDIRVPYTRLVVFIVAIVVTLVLDAFIRRTRTGHAIRATSFDRDAARLVGMDPSRVYATTLGLGAATAGIAGVLLSVVFSFAPSSATGLTTKAFVVVILGGLGSIPGAIFGGILLGVTENVSSLVVAPGYRDLIGFLLVLVVLIWSRRGLLGKRYYAEI